MLKENSKVTIPNVDTLTIIVGCSLSKSVQKKKSVHAQTFVFLTYFEERFSFLFCLCYVLFVHVCFLSAYAWCIVGNEKNRTADIIQ